MSCEVPIPAGFNVGLLIGKAGSNCKVLCCTPEYAASRVVVVIVCSSLSCRLVGVPGVYDIPGPIQLPTLPACPPRCLC